MTATPFQFSDRFEGLHYADHIFNNWIFKINFCLGKICGLDADTRQTQDSEPKSTREPEMRARRDGFIHT